MRIEIPTLIALVYASPLSAQNSQFDLECDYGEQTRSFDGKVEIGHTAPRHFQVDLEDGRWCEGYCSEYSIAEIVKDGNNQITLIDREPYEGQRRTLVYYRDAGVLEENYSQSGAQVKRSYACTTADFAGFVPSKITAPYTSETRLMRYFIEGRGRKILRLGPKGVFRLRVKVDIRADGAVGDCEAQGPTPQPKLEEKVCDALTGGEFRFRPGTDRNGEPAAKRWQHTFTMLN